MLKIRVIPIVLIDGYSVLKTIQFDERRNLGNPITVARIYNTRNVDELVLLDIDASKEKRKIDLTTIEEIASECFMPLSVGGGLRTLGDISKVLASGADKVVINSIALEEPTFVKEAVKTFGSQCIIVSIDINRTESGEYTVYSHANVPIKYSLENFIDMMISNGAGELLINSVNNDGLMKGYDTQLFQYIRKKIDIPVIAAGGAGSPQHAVSVLEAGASAVAAASIFHFSDFTPNKIKEEMHKSSFPVRL